MPVTKKKQVVRRSISVATDLDARVQKLAKLQNRSANQMFESLLEAGLAAKENEKRRFFELAEQLRSASDPDQIQRIKLELSRMTFGS
jgi:hypothetical protein